MSVMQTVPFGTLLKQLRKRAGMTQRDLAAALGYSDSLISSLEKAQRLPDLQAIRTYFIPALGLQDDPISAAHLIDSAAATRGGQRPVSSLPSEVRSTYPLHARSATVHRLPLLPIDVIGRTLLVNQLSNRLLGHGGRLLTLVGPPGVGKTTLALAVATQVQHHYPNGVLFVPLAAVNDPMMMATTLVATIAPGAVSSKPPESRLIEGLSQQHLLLLLDNLEQIEGASSLIATLLAKCPSLTLLATSRERLHLRAEQRCKVPPLALPAAVKLFVQRSQAVDDKFDLNAGNRSLIAAICTRLDCLPLALELCAAQVELLTPAQLLARLQQRSLDLLVDGAHDLPPHHRTLRLAIQRSYALLGEDEQMLFRRLGVFVGGFDQAAVEMIGDSTTLPATRHSPLVTLQSLTGKSLVSVETLADGKQRFFLLETLREYALEQLQVHGETEAVRQCHYAFYLQLFRTGDGHLRSAQAGPWVTRLENERDNLRVALQWTIDEARYVDTQWLVIASIWYWVITGKWYEFGRWPRQLLPYRHLLPSSLHLVMLINIYAFARAVEELHPINRFNDEIVQLIEVSPHPGLRATAWHFIAAYYSDFSQAAAARERSIAAARLARERPTLGSEYGLLSDCDFVLGLTLWTFAYELVERVFFDQAIPLLRECQDIFRQRENHYLINYVSGTLGRLAFLQNDLGQAHVYLQEAVNIAITFNYGELIGLFQPTLALVTAYLGEIQTAKRLLDDSLQICIELKDKRFLAQIALYWAELSLMEGDTEEAEQQVHKILNDQGIIHQTIDEVGLCFVGARLATGQHQYQRAAILFGLAEAARSKIHYVIDGPMRALADAALATVQAALEPAAFAESFAAGQQMPIGEAFSTLS